MRLKSATRILTRNAANAKNQFAAILLTKKFQPLNLKKILIICSGKFPMKTSISLKTLMVGFCMFIRIVPICYQAVFVVFMRLAPGFAGSIQMITANTTYGLGMELSFGFPPISNSRNIVANASKNGISALNSTSKNSNSFLPYALVFITLALIAASATAQEPTLASRIQAASDSLTLLDLKAKSCMDNLAQESTDQATSSCEEFLQSVNGELLADYLANCEVLKTWREQFVTGELERNKDAEEYLDLLSGIEFSCGENALQRRTESVVSVFNILRGNSSQSQTASTLSRRIAESEFEQTSNAERRLLQDSIQRQQQRSLLQSDRQWDDLQEELIRQQINRPPFPNN